MTSKPLPAADLDHILDHTLSLWQVLAGSHLFITGGTGFFGKWLLETLVAANDRLAANVSATVLSRNPQAFLADMPHLAHRSEFQWQQGDVRDFAFPSQTHDYVLHLATAASAQLNETDPLTMLNTIVQGTRHTLAYARHCGAKRMLLTSSGAVYGHQPEHLSHIPEHYLGGPDPLVPASAYAEGKRMAELLCTLTPEVPTIIARCFAFIGPHLPLDAHFAAGNFLRDALQGGPIQVQGDGTAERSYLYAADLVIWLLTLLLHGQAGQAYNVGSEDTINTGQLATKIAAAAVLKDPQVRIHCPPSPGPVHRYVPATQHCRETLGLQSWIDQDEAIKRSLHWLDAIPHA